MDHEEKNGTNLPPQMSDEEWEAYWAKIDAETPEQLSDEDWQVHLDLHWAATDPELQRLYPDKIVAAYKQKLVAVGDDIQAVRKEAMRITGLPRNRIAITTVLGSKSLFGYR